MNASIGALCGCLCLQERCLLCAYYRLLMSAIEAAMAESLIRVDCRLGMSQQKLTWALNFYGDHAAFLHSCETWANVCTLICCCCCVSQVHSPKLKPAKKAALEKLLRDAMNACLVKPFVDAAQADRRRSLRAMSQAWISYLANAQVTSVAWMPGHLNASQCRPSWSSQADRQDTASEASKGACKGIIITGYPGRLSGVITNRCACLHAEQWRGG